MTVTLTGTLTCAPEEASAVREALVEHTRLSRAEPGCLRFEVTEREPGVFFVSEAFIDDDAFDAHQTRTRDSAWWQLTSDMPRDFTKSGAKTSA